MPRPAYQPSADDREDVREWAHNGVANIVIAQRLGIHRKTLVKHFNDELDLGRAEAMAKCMEALMYKVGIGNVPAIRLWLQLRREAAEMDGRTESQE